MGNVLGAMLIAVALSATPHTRAKKLYDQATVAFKVGRFEEALSSYTAAYQIDAVPSLLFDIGQCHREMGHWKEALFFFNGYLRDLPEAENRPLVERFIAASEAKLREAVAQRRAPAAAPAPERPIVVIAEPPLRLAPPSAPPPALEALAMVPPAPPRPGRSHAVALGFFSGAAVAAGFAVTGAVRVAGYEGDLGRAARTQGYTDYLNAASRAPNAANWQTAAIALGALAVAAGLAGGLTW